jgi:hypothetical protein
VGKRRHNLPKLRESGFAANRKLREVEQVKHSCILADFDNIPKVTNQPSKAPAWFLIHSNHGWWFMPELAANQDTGGKEGKREPTGPKISRLRRSGWS